VKGAEERLGQRRVVQQTVNALAHFAGGLVGEGNGQNGVRSDAFFTDEPGNAAVMTRVLPEPAPAKNEQWSLGGLDGGALFGISGWRVAAARWRPGGKGPGSSVPFRASREQSARPAVPVECADGFLLGRLLTRE